MLLLAASFLTGIVIFQQLNVLPSLLWALLLPFALFSLLFSKKYQFVGLCICGFLWALIRADITLSENLDAALESKEVVVEGVVASMPRQGERSLRFDFDVSRLSFDDKEYASPGRIRLSWYGQTSQLIPGESRTFTVKLKRPHGNLNPGGFDYEAWLFQQRIRAVGYVRAEHIQQELESPTHRPRYALARFRQTVTAHLQTVLTGLEHTGIIMALAVGERQSLNNHDWAVLRATGTNHLLAISGLHIGLVAGLGLLFFSWLWSMSAWLCLRLPARQAGLISGFLLALLYSALAGFAIPTQRALIMLTVFVVGSLLKRSISPAYLLATALIAVLLWDPFAVMSVGFWLSFAAVALLIYGMSGRLAVRSWWWRWGWAQCLLAVGLLPFLLFMFFQVSLIAPLANIIAVPWMSFLVVPLVLFSTLVSFLFNDLGVVLFTITDWFIAVLWHTLEFMAALPMAQWTQHAPPVWALLCGVVGTVWLIAPKGIPLRWIGVIWLLPLLIVVPDRPLKGQFEMTLLDVGQGLSAAIITRNHALVYDVGVSLGDNFDMGRQVVVPFLQYRGLSTLDVVVVSHGDNDHIGGLNSVIEAIDVQRLLTSVPQKIDNFKAEHCAQQSWTWDGVYFEILHPESASTHWQGNNASCVLRISAGDDSVLLTGDIEQAAELSLVARLRDDLSTDILVAAHHGSKTSSTIAFVDTVQAKIVLFPVGYRNRWNFPATKIVDRFTATGAQVYDTAQEGAISLLLGDTINDGFNPKSFRDTSRYYWH
ncbi:DNA internalization-related competence protein ComEC/Rec2 [hydrothermal vent metagenome]|uniref:DNA internalization-related competence protein ComEC/Rec2 n=1 Tax=hydrothermal vent metagenome TaxID=652676 RepID=A0A3B0ZZD2_9ZZZZ